MSTLSSANVTDVNLVLKERTHMRLCLNMLIFTHNLGNWLICVVAGAQLTDLNKTWLGAISYRQYAVISSKSSANNY